MTAAAPWSVKGIDPKAREVAKDLARRSGMTLGEWLNRVILEDDVPEEVTSEAHFGVRPHRAVSHTPTSFMQTSPNSSGPDDLGRIAFALDLLTDRIESSEMRTGLAISGVEHSVRHAMARLETAEREQSTVAARLDAANEQLATDRASAAERLRRMEEELSGPRSAAVLKALEDSITRVASQVADVSERVAEVAGQVAEGEARNREGLAALESRLALAEGRQDPAVMIEDVVARLGRRMADAEARTGEALEGLRDSLAQLDQRMHAADGSIRSDMDHRLEALADQLAQRVEAARSEVAERLATASSDLLEARLGQITEEVAAVEQRSARAIETMGREVLGMAETLSRRVQSAEQRSAEAIEQVGGEIARIAGAVEGRLGRTDQLHAEALERLGAEIGRITDRLTDRILQSERRAAQAIDDVGEQVAAVTERIEQRHERAAGDLAERLRQSEERTARLLEDAEERLGAASAAQAFHARFAPPPVETLAEPPGAAATHPAEAFAPAAALAFEPAQDELPVAPTVFGAELFSRAEPLTQPALDPGNPAFDDEDYAAVDAFAPIPETERDDDLLDLDAPPAAEPVQEIKPLSTREVIEQARAAARAAAAAAPREKTLQAPDPEPRRPRGLFGALKSGRQTSTWQTALMVAGGAAFLSVGAAGVVLMEGPRATRQAQETQPFDMTSPRAALALTPAPRPQAQSPVAAIEASTHVQEAAAPGAASQPDLVASDYVDTVRAVEAKQPGALAHLKILADGGWAPAQLYLAGLYENGHAGVAQNLAEARRWTARAADAGDPPAMHNLALYYFRGEGGPQDAAAAAQWFKKAAQHGVVDSQYNLGLLYQSGSGVPRDLGQAYKWFMIAANAGDGEARASAADLAAKLPATQVAAAENQAGAFQPAPGAAVAASAPDASSPALSVATAKKVLGRLGYYNGRTDGAVTHQLKLAVSAYQRDQGLAATGSLDAATVSRLSVLTR